MEMRNLVKNRISLFSVKQPSPLKSSHLIRTVHMKPQFVRDENGSVLAIISEHICNKELPKYLGKHYLDESWQELGNFIQEIFNPKEGQPVFWIGGALQTIYTPMGIETKEKLQAYVNESHCLSAVCSLEGSRLTVHEKSIVDFGSFQPKKPKDAITHYNGRELLLKKQDYQEPAIHNRSSRRIRIFLSNPMAKEASEGAKMISFIAQLNRTDYTLEQIIQNVEAISKKSVYMRRDYACSHALPIQALAETARLLYGSKGSFIHDQVADVFFPYLEYPLELGLRHRHKENEEQKKAEMVSSKLSGFTR